MSEQTFLDAFTFSPAFQDLAIDQIVIEHDLGYPDGTAPEPVRQSIAELLPEVPRRTSIQCGFRILPQGSVTVTRDVVKSDGIQFSVGPILAKQLENSTSLALFVATAGPAMEQWSGRLMADGDMIKGFIVDTIASEVAEQSSGWLEKRIAQHVEARGWSITNRYSPGYCDWPVSEQHKLFSLLPQGFCGISLTPSALMVPVKSLSGVIGLGPDVKRGEFQCSICDLKDCFRRRDDPALAAG